MSGACLVQLCFLCFGGRCTCGVESLPEPDVHIDGPGGAAIAAAIGQEFRRFRRFEPDICRGARRALGGGRHLAPGYNDVANRIRPAERGTEGEMSILETAL